MRLIATLLFSFLVAGFSGGAGADEIKPVIKYEYYDVNVKDEGGIVEEAFRATPIRMGGTKYLGEANCATGYTYTSAQNDGGQCGVKDYQLTLDCVVTLPRFNGLSEEAVPKIEAFMERITYHEHEHCRIFAEYANRFKQWIDAGPVSGCNSLANNIRTAFNRTRNECKTVQDKYDKDTMHGRTEGADLEWHLASDEDRLMMAEGVTAPAVKVVPEITYDYFDVAVREEGVGNWRTATGGIEWSAGFNYKPRRNIDETCRVMRYDVNVGCKVNLPRFTGGSDALQPDLAAKVEELKKIQIDRCELVVAEADKFVAEISGDKTFHCDRMRGSVTALHNQLMKDAKEAIQKYDQAREGASAPAAGSVKSEVEYKYYDVPLSDADQALDEALKQSRLGRGGQKVPSGAQVKMGYSYMPKQLPDGACRVLEYELTLNCAITLPRFKSGQAEVLKKAEPLAEKLKAMELKRCGIAEDQADQLGQWLGGDRTFPCGPMANNIRGRFNQVVKDIRQAMEDYVGDED